MLGIRVFSVALALVGLACQRQSPPREATTPSKAEASGDAHPSCAIHVRRAEYSGRNYTLSPRGDGAFGCNAQVVCAFVASPSDGMQEHAAVCGDFKDGFVRAVDVPLADVYADNAFQAGPKCLDRQPTASVVAPGASASGSGALAESAGDAEALRACNALAAQLAKGQS